MKKYGSPEPVERAPEDPQGVSEGEISRTAQLDGLYSPQEIIQEEASADAEIADRG